MEREYRDEVWFRKDVEILIEKMKGYKPDIIIPLLRGGQAPCVYVAESLKVLDVRPISVEREGEKRRIAFPPKENIGEVKGKKILLLEDDIPTGKSLIHVKKVLEEKGAEVKIGVVYVLPETKKYVDFYGYESDPLPDLYFKPSRKGDRIID